MDQQADIPVNEKEVTSTFLLNKGHNDIALKNEKTNDMSALMKLAELACNSSSTNEDGKNPSINNSSPSEQPISKPNSELPMNDNIEIIDGLHMTTSDLPHIRDKIQHKNILSNTDDHSDEISHQEIPVKEKFVSVTEQGNKGFLSTVMKDNLKVFEESQQDNVQKLLAITDQNKAYEKNLNDIEKRSIGEVKSELQDQVKVQFELKKVSQPKDKVETKMTESVVEKETAQSGVETEMTESVVGKETTQSGVESEMTESVVEKETTQSGVETEMTESGFETEMTESGVETKITESGVETEMTESVVEKETTQSGVETEMTESVVEKETTQSGVESEMTESVVEKETTQSGVETEMTESVVEKETTQSGVESEMTESVVEKETTQSGVETEMTESVVEKETAQSGVETEMTESVVEKETTQSGVESEMTESVVEKETTQSGVETEMTESVVGKETTQSGVETEMTESVVEKETTQSGVESEMTESVVEKETTQSEVETEMTESGFETEMTESGVETRITEYGVETEMTESVVEKEMTESGFETEMTESGVETRITESGFETEMTESVVEKETTQSGVESEMTESVVEKETTQSGVETEMTESVVETRITEYGVETEMTESVVEKETTQSGVETEMTESVVEKEATQSVVEKEATQSVVEKEATQSGVEKETTQSAVEKETTQSAVEKETTQSAVEKETTQSAVEKEMTTEPEAKETAKSEAKETAKSEAKETAESEAKETAESEAKETAESEAMETAESEAMETAESEALETKVSEALETEVSEAMETIESGVQELSASHLKEHGKPSVTKVADLLVNKRMDAIAAKSRDSAVKPPTDTKYLEFSINNGKALSNTKFEVKEIRDKAVNQSVEPVVKDLSDSPVEQLLVTELSATKSTNSQTMERTDGGDRELNKDAKFVGKMHENSSGMEKSLEVKSQIKISQNIKLNKKITNKKLQKKFANIEKYSDNVPLNLSSEMNDPSKLLKDKKLKKFKKKNNWNTGTQIISSNAQSISNELTKNTVDLEQCSIKPTIGKTNISNQTTLLPKSQKEKLSTDNKQVGLKSSLNTDNELSHTGRLDSGNEIGIAQTQNEKNSSLTKAFDINNKKQCTTSSSNASIEEKCQLYSLSRVCVKCQTTWNDVILDKLFDGSKPVTINSRITYGAIICMNNFANRFFKDRQEKTVRALLERADIGKSSVNMVTLDQYLQEALKMKEIHCCDFFKPLYSPKKLHSPHKKALVSKEIKLDKIIKSEMQNNSRNTKTIGEILMNTNDTWLHSRIIMERDSIVDCSLIRMYNRLHMDGSLANSHELKVDKLNRLPLRNIDMINFYNGYKSSNLEAFYKLLVQILSHRKRIALFFHESMLEVSQFLFKNIDSQSKEFLNEPWDLEQLYSSDSLTINLNERRTLTRDILTTFCAWKNSTQVVEELKQKINHLFEGIQIADCLGLCIRLYAKYSNLAFVEKDVFKTKMFLNLCYLPQKELSEINHPTILPPDMSLIPSSSKPLGDWISHLESNASKSSSLKRPLPESFTDYKLVQTKKLKKQILNHAKTPKHLSLLEDYGTLKTNLETISNRKSVSDSASSLSEDDIKLMFIKLKKQNLSSNDICSVIEKLVNL